MKLKIVTDATCRRTAYFKGQSSGAVQFYDLESGEVIREEGFILGDMTPYSAEAETMFRALDIASELTRQYAEIWTDSQTLVRQMNGLWLLKASDSKHYFDKIKQVELRITGVGGVVKYFHHHRTTSLAKAAHSAAAKVFEKHHIR